MEFAPQGSREWHEQRLGKVTASRFEDMMTNGRGTGSMGKTAYSYMWDLIAETLTGEPQDNLGDLKAIKHGNEHEPAARALYCLLRDVRVVKTGFVPHPSFEGVGGSPDGLVEGDPEGPGGAEIKCPLKTRIHLQYMHEGITPKDYWPQVQGLMWITGRSWWDFVSFDPRLEKEGLMLFVHRERADVNYHEELTERAERFLGQLKIKLDKVRAMKHEFN